MIWINLSVVILILGYGQWLFYRGRRFSLDLSHTGNARQVLQSVVQQRRFYFNHAIGTLSALALFLGIKALLLLFKLPEPTAFTAFAFGDFASRFLIVKLGCLGIGLPAISAGCFYQYIKSKHYFDVLYALRNPLELEELDKTSSEPAVAPVAKRAVF